ncbi:MAG: STAS domain-containing protein [Planctomycetota bacterium]
MPASSDSPIVSQLSNEKGVVTAKLHTDITVACVPQTRLALQEMIKQTTPSRFVVDMADVGYMDSSGLAALVEAKKRLPATTPLVLRNLSPDVKGLMKIMNLNLLFEFEDTADSPT